jgi:hypothetical protein
VTDFLRLWPFYRTAAGHAIKSVTPASEKSLRSFTLCSCDASCIRVCALDRFDGLSCVACGAHSARIKVSSVDGRTRAALREESWHGKEVEDQDRSRQLLHLKVTIAGRIACEADVRDAAELRMSIGWAKTVWPNTLTSAEASRNGKSIVFANRIEMGMTDSYCRSGISARDVERVELDTLGELPEQPLIDMMVRE